MKINPSVNEDKINEIVALFPNIQTIQVRNLSIEIPSELLSKITYIRVIDKMKFKLRSSRTIPYYSVNPPNFKLNKFESYHLKIDPNCIYSNSNEMRNYQNDSLYYNIFFNCDKTIIEKLEEFTIYSFETSSFFIEHYNLFKSLKSLYIVLDNNSNGNKKLCFDNNLELFDTFSHIRFLKNVYIHSINTPLYDEYIDNIKSLTFITFTFIFYSFCNSDKDKYDTLQRLCNSDIFFTCLTNDVLLNGYPITSFRTKLDNKKRKSIIYSKNDNMNSKSIQLLCDLLKKFYYCLPSLHLNDFDMNSLLDFSTIYLNHLDINFCSIGSFELLTPTTLTSINLCIDWISVSSKIPKLSFNNANIKKIELNGFQYDTTQQLYVNEFPDTINLKNCSYISIISTNTTNENLNINTENSIQLFSCSNILITTLISYSINWIYVEFCDNIKVNTLTALFEKTNNIKVQNIPYVKISDDNCFDYQFEFVNDLDLSVITPLINIYFPSELTHFSFNIIPNDNNIQLPTFVNTKEQIITLKDISLQNVYLTGIQEMNFIFSSTLKELCLRNCENIKIKTIDDCVLDYFNYNCCVNCNIQNISTEMILKQIPFDADNCGIVMNNIVIDDNYYSCEYTDNKDDLDYKENELDELIDRATIIGPHAFQHRGIKDITLPDSVKEIQNNCSYFGIDIGTSSVKISKMNNNEPDRVRFISGDFAVPSMIYYVNDNQILFGADARKKMASSGSSIYDTKRFFGKEFNDPIIQKDLKSVGYATQKMDNKLVGIFLDSKNKKLVPAHEVTKILLEKAIENSDARNEIKMIVLTVPQSFGENQRELMRALAKDLGFRDVHIMDEPTAAALSCGYASGKINTFAVFDFGGGTLDINVMCVTRGVKQEFEVLATGGDSHCGGSDVDLKLVELVLGKIEDEDPDVEFDDCEDECERIHEHFSNKKRKVKIEDEVTKNKDTIYMPYIDEDGDEHTIEITITQEEYITVAEELMNKAINELVNTIDQYKKSKKFKQNIEEVLLVGGGSLIPTLKDRIEQRINLPTRIYKNPIHAVVEGAALKRGSTLMDSVLGIRRVDTLIDKGDTIPCTVTRQYKVSKDGQRHIELKLYENTSLPLEKYALGSLTVNLNDLTKKGDKVILHIELQEGGTLKIKATLPDTRIPIEVDDIVELRRKIQK
ncbi:hypothetical protein QTN25_002552 [Entamoeba marina]